MFRILLAVAAVALLFGGVVYASGDYLQAWESPTTASSPQGRPAPAPKKAAKRKTVPRRAAHRKTRRTAPRKPAWLMQLNTLCRRGQDEVAAIPTPITEAAYLDYLHQVARVSRRSGRRTTALLGSAPRTREIERLLRLSAQGDRLLEELVSAADRGQAERLRRSVQAMIAVGRSENRILARLGATDCTLSDAFDY